jgi:hypothetical protein
MRFIESGPNIPDELLFARDNGDVLFFCGAGVSQQKAKLPSFQGLVDRLCGHFYVGEDHPVKKISEYAPGFEKKIGITGLVSADRLFGLLEKDYGVAEIQRAVSLALKPQNDQVGPHETMLALATDSKQKVKLVTTNFDRLFERCDPELPIYCYPNLPNPSVVDSMHGITYLHGFVDEKYETAESNVFVVSSADFGRAYLSEGWATNFIKSVLENYIVVFVGYSADDPPVNYLLEALSRDPLKKYKMYAFAEGPTDDANGNWEGKGVEPIVFNKGDFDSLWNTLEEWAKRAKSPTEWYKSRARLAESAPSKCSAVERGQVANTVSCAQGMQLFAEHSNTPHPEWLCVFDASIRYSVPGHIGRRSDPGEYFDPFAAYGIDSDSDVELFRNEKNFRRRRFPENVWHFFSYTPEDTLDVGPPTGISLTAYGVEISDLPRRLRWFRHWVGKLVNEPALMWWALQQSKLHPDLKRGIESAIERNPEEYSESVVLAWRLIFLSWENCFHYSNLDASYYWKQIETHGWSDALLLKWSESAKPAIEIEKPFRWNFRPATKEEAKGILDLVTAKVKYPEPCWSSSIEVPAKYLPVLVREYRKKIERAVFLKRLIGDVHCYLSPIVRDEKIKGTESGRSYGENGFFLHFVELFKKLCTIDIYAARTEFKCCLSMMIHSSLV